jgi:hypothetical protein
VESSAPGTWVDIAIELAPVHRLEPIRAGREDATDIIVTPRDGTDRRELRGAAAIEGIGIDGEQRTDPVGQVNRHRPGDDRGDVAVQHRKAGGDRTPVSAVLQPSLELCERHGSRHHRRRFRTAICAHAAACVVRSRAAFQFQASSSCS